MPRLRGPLYRGDYPRKPRGGQIPRRPRHSGDDSALLRPRWVPSSGDAAVGAVSRPTRVRRGRRDCRERDRVGRRERSGRGASDRRRGAHDATLASLVARAVHDERPVRGAVGAAGAVLLAKHVADFHPRSTRRRAGRARLEAAPLVGAAHDGGHAERIAFAAGPCRPVAAPPRSRRRCRYPCFLALA